MSSVSDRRRIEGLLSESRRETDERLEILLPAQSEAPSSLHSAMRYSVLGGGKRIRAILCQWTHRLFGDPYPKVSLDVSCAIECLHAYTLIHDDLPIMDDDDMRRGRPSCHVKYGEGVALLAGDALQALAFEIISGCRGAPPGDILEASRILASAAGSRMLVGGQVADMEGEGKTPAPEIVRFIHSRKTAELISASMATGAALSGAGKEVIDEILDTGRKIGLAFQIVDDLLDLEGSEEIVGKGLRKDDKRGKITWPATFGAGESRETASLLIEEASEKIRKLGDDGEIEYVFRLITDRVS